MLKADISLQHFLPGQLNVYGFNRLDSTTLASLLDLSSSSESDEGAISLSNFHGWRQELFCRDEERKSDGMVPRISPARKRIMDERAANGGKKVKKADRETLAKVEKERKANVKKVTKKGGK